MPIGLDSKTLALSIFVLAYLLFILMPARRTQIAVFGSVLTILFGVLSPTETFLAINWNVIGMFTGMQILAYLFMTSRVPAYFAEVIVNKSKNTAWAILWICIMTSFISAFVDNVTTVLIVAPVALALAKKIKLNPVNMLIGIAVSSNLQGCATLIGDPPSMLLGGYAHITFGDFFLYHGKPSIFWAIQLGAIFSMTVLYWFFNKHTTKTSLPLEEKIRSWVPAILLLLLIVFLASSSFFDQGFPYTAGLSCLSFALVGLIWGKIFAKTSFRTSIKNVDWETLFFLAGIFILVGSLSATGWVETIARGLGSLIGGNVLGGYILLIVVSVIASAFIDNIPFLATMLPVASSVATGLQVEPFLFLAALLIGTSLGGNITPIGASANIVACGILKREGHPVSFGQFMKIGLPFTLAAVIVGSIFIWFVWR